jgi:hypothetical protein
MKSCFSALAAIAISLVFVLPALAAGNIASFNVTVPPQQFKALRVRNLPEGALIGVVVKSSREVTVAFVDHDDYQRLPKPKKPLMVGKVDQRLKFSVTIPESGHYYVVLVNNQAIADADVQLTVRAARSPKDQIQSAERILQEFEKQMHKIFIFDTFPVGIEPCGRAQAFYGVDGFYLCAEYVQILYAKLRDRQMAINALGFSIFHELALELMQQWEIDRKLMRERADEFAVVMMVMLNQDKRLKDLATYVAKNPDVDRALKVSLIEDWHPLSSRRAADVLDWLEDADLVRGWQKTLVPHMQTILLQHLRKKPAAWTDSKLVEKELSRRKTAEPGRKPGDPSEEKSKELSL